MKNEDKKYFTLKNQNDLLANFEYLKNKFEFFHESR